MVVSLRIEEISDRAGTGPVILTGQEAAKAWANLDAKATIVLRDSFNISSVVDNSTGDTDFNFTNNFSDADYCTNYSVSRNSTGSVDIRIVHKGLTGGSPFASGSCQTSVNDRSGTAEDAGTVCLSVLGDLA